MRCTVCGREYPSRYYFKEGNVCMECNEGTNGEARPPREEAAGEPGRFEVAGVPLDCPHCMADRFIKKRMRVYEEGADAYICRECGHVLWFLEVVSGN